jgi:hypothetical protein
MPSESLLDGGGRGVAQAISGVLTAVVAVLLVAVLVPVVILGSLLGGVARTFAPPFALDRPGVTVTPVVSPPSDNEPPAANPAVDAARRYLGIPYVFGGTNPAVGLDCSGLVQLVFRQLGISLPRTAQQQYDATLRVGRPNLQPGDLVFFARTYDDPFDYITHVGIYIGDGLQINAPTEGQVVSIQPVFTGFWGAHFAGGGRPKGTPPLAPTKG